MAKQLKPLPNSREELDALLNEEQTNSSASSEAPTVPDSGKAPAVGKKSDPAPSPRVGDPCPQRGCPGKLSVMSTFVDEKEKVRTLCCIACKRVGGEERIPR